VISTEELTEGVRQLILESAPERRSDLEDLWRRFAPNFAHASDTKGFKMEGGPWGLVVFTPRTTLQIWILGFASWKAFEAYHPYVLIPVPLTTANDPDRVEIEKALATDLRTERELNETAELQTFMWPQHIPQPGPTPPTNTRDHAVVDLVKIATAFVFLHEVRHAIFRDENNAPESSIDEEFACDEFARDYLLDQIPLYCAETGDDQKAVLDKRLMGIVLGAFVLLQITPEDRRSGSADHPAVVARFRKLIRRQTHQSGRTVFVYACSLLFGTLRQEGNPPPEVSFGNPETLFEDLLALL